MPDSKYFVCKDSEKRCLIAVYCYMKGFAGMYYDQFEINEFESRISVGILIDNDLLMYSSYGRHTTLRTDDNLYLTNGEQE